MKIKVLSLVSLVLIARAASGLTVVVPATSDLWLAGMPNGSTASISDSAPGQSPTPVTGIAITGGTPYFFQASGSASRGPGTAVTGPDGDLSGIALHWTAMLVANPENGIANVLVPGNALVGVFLGPDQPNFHATPAALDFTTQASRDYLTLCPQLQQPFFIGDGLTSLGIAQQVIAPVGATRLFLGTMDNYEWSNNEGGFTVQVVPEPAVTTLAMSMLALSMLARKHKNQKN